MSVAASDKGPVVIAYDGSRSSNHAVRDTSRLLGRQDALVVHVWEPGLAFELLTPTIPPAPIDIRAALEVDEQVYEAARRLAEQGAALAREAGFHAHGLTVADELTVADTLVRVARERNAPGIVVGSHGHRGVTEVLMGSTTKAIMRVSPCPVVVSRADPGD